MTSNEYLALVRAAERLGRLVSKYLPYTDEVPENMRAFLNADINALNEDLAFVRGHMTKAEAAVLDAAEQEGR